MASVMTQEQQATLDLDDLFKIDFKVLQKKIDKAKYIITKEGGTFLTFLMLNLKHKIGTEVPTAATDGSTVIYNPNFIKDMPEKQLAGLIAHELWHVAFEHMLRKGNRDHKLWNMAGDYVINDFLISKGFTLPPEGLVNKQYKGMSTEQVYEKLVQKQNSLPELSMPDLIIVDQSTETASKIKEILVKAKNASIMNKDYGNIPGEIDLAIEELINPVLDWKQMLRRFIDSHTKNDFSWRKPNKKLFPDYYMPSQYSESISNITIAIDTSGSISNGMIQEFLTETYSIITTMKVDKTTVIDCDSKINSITEIESVEDIMDIEFKGGGGTSVFPVLNYLEENPTNILIYFTDGYFKQPEEDVNYPIIWVVRDNPRYIAPIGETCYYE